MANFVVPMLFAANALLTDGMTEAQRLNALKPFITPPPGSTLKLADYEIRDRKAQDGMKLRGFIHFNPPKGTCFTVTRWRDQDDDVICKARELSFSVKDLDAAGRLRWHISTGGKDFGQEYIWHSPYRAAQVIRAGNDKAHEPTELALLNCKAEVLPEHFQIVLHLHRNRYWTIRFPKTGAKKPSTATDTVNSDSKGDSNETAKPATTKAALERWQLNPERAFWMSATNFRASDTPPGINGECLYEFKQAARDPDSGWLECHNTDLYDVVFVHLPCAKDLPID